MGRVVVKSFRNCQPSGPDMQALQDGSKWEVGLGNRMESDSLEHRAVGLCGGRGDETGKGSWRCHDVKDLESR